MIEQRVKSIYDQLSSFESNRRFKGAYPIHKKLVFEDLEINDIYYWLIKTITVKENCTILDAGCGVGYGSLLLSKALNASVLGISLSTTEINKATTFLAQKNTGANCRFLVQSFDDPFEQKFDLIVAIESLKHAPRVQETVQHLYQQLLLGGQLVIVEDLWNGDPITSQAQQLIDDWSLAKLYTKNDYQIQPIDQHSIRYIKLDPFIPKKNKWKIRAQYLLTNMMAKFQKKENNLHQIYRGGFILDQLYLAGKMSYQAIVISKTDNTQ